MFGKQKLWRGGVSRIVSGVIATTLVLIILCAQLSRDVHAAENDFYKGKEITLLIAFAVGSATDVHGRLIARHLSRFIPGNPSIIAQNNPAAGGVVAHNHLYGRAAPDGLTIALASSGTITRQLTRREGVRYDFRKSELVGANTPESRFVYVRADLGVASIGDLYKLGKPVITGWSSRGGGPDVLLELIFRVLNLERKPIYGYKGGPDISLAMLRGEIDLSSENEMIYPTSHVRLEKDGQIRLIGQTGIYTKGRFVRSELISHVPTIEESYQKHFGKPPSGPFWEAFRALSSVPTRTYWVPPGTPADRVQLLQRAFEAMSRDPEYKKDSKKILGQIDVMEAEGKKEIINSYLDLPEEIWKLFVP